MNSDELITELKKTKDQIRDLNNEVKELKGREDELARSLMTEMDKTGLKRMANDLATVSVATEIVPDPTDWDLFYQYIKDTGQFELLHKRISLPAFRELLQSQEVPGIQSRELMKLNFRTT
jgi:hypothetical protein